LWHPKENREVNIPEAIKIAALATVSDNQEAAASAAGASGHSNNYSSDHAQGLHDEEDEWVPS